MELFFHHKASPFVRKVLLAAHELDVRFVERPVDFASPAAMDVYAELNPNRRFPALRDRDLVLWESGAILRYLAAEHDVAWLGRTPRIAARVDQWLFWELAHLGPALLGLQNLRLGFLPRPQRDEAALVADGARALSVLDGALVGHTFVAGDAITIADLALAAAFTYADEADLVDPRFTAVRRWLAAIRGRPSWAATEAMKAEALRAFGVTLPRRSTDART